MGKQAEHVRYRVWIPENDETEEAAAEYGALDEKCAAEYHAQVCHNQRSGWEWSYPKTFHVRNLASGKTFAVEVDRHTVPEFEAGRPKEVTP